MPENFSFSYAQGNIPPVMFGDKLPTWGKEIYLHNPSETPFYTVMEMLPKKRIRTQVFNWMEDILIPVADTVAVALSGTGAGWLGVTNPGYYLTRAVVERALDGELLLVTQVDVTNSRIYVDRDIVGDGAGASSIAAGESLLILPTSRQEESTALESINLQRGIFFNFLQMSSRSMKMSLAELARGSQEKLTDKSEWSYQSDKVISEEKRKLEGLFFRGQRGVLLSGSGTGPSGVSPVPLGTPAPPTVPVATARTNIAYLTGGVRGYLTGSTATQSYWDYGNNRLNFADLRRILSAYLADSYGSSVRHVFMRPQIHLEFMTLWGDLVRPSSFDMGDNIKFDYSSIQLGKVKFILHSVPTLHHYDDSGIYILDLGTKGSSKYIEVYHNDFGSENHVTNGLPTIIEDQAPRSASYKMAQFCYNMGFSFRGADKGAHALIDNVQYA